MEYNISNHATDQFKIRQIDLALIDEIMNIPDLIITAEGTCKQVFQKVIIVDSKSYLYRLFVNVCKTPALIITGYRTSKIKKYEN
jgi:hypothetical protein